MYLNVVEVVAKEHKRTTVVCSIPTRNIKYLEFSFTRSSNEVKGGVEFRH